MIKMIFLLSDEYGNEIATSSEDVANEILESGCNPFNNMDEVEEYNGLIVDSYDEFCNAFY